MLAANCQNVPHLAETKYCENVGLPFWVVVVYCPSLHAEANRANEQAYPKDVPSEAVCENAFARFAGRQLHDVLLGGFAGEGKSGEPVGYEVDPKDVDGQQRNGQPGEWGKHRHIQLWPHVHGTDAMFLALLERPVASAEAQ